MRILTWGEFDSCINRICSVYGNRSYSGVYGIPRGGLCLAVALSHALGLQMLNNPKEDALIVDDIYETGETLKKTRCLPGIITVVWISKVVPEWWNAIEVTDSTDWIVFPWEQVNKASSDLQSYRISRGWDS